MKGEKKKESCENELRDSTNQIKESTCLLVLKLLPAIIKQMLLLQQQQLKWEERKGMFSRRGTVEIRIKEKLLGAEMYAKGRKVNSVYAGILCLEEIIFLLEHVLLPFW